MRELGFRAVAGKAVPALTRRGTRKGEGLMAKCCGCGGKKKAPAKKKAAKKKK